MQRNRLEPRWDAKEFPLVKQSIISQIRQQEANPTGIAQNQYNQLIFGKDNIRSKNIVGTIDTINSITPDDLKAFYTSNDQRPMTNHQQPTINPQPPTKKPVSIFFYL